MASFLVLVLFLLSPVFLVLLLLFYFLPAIIAARRGRHNAGAIFALNLFLGWLFVGWVIALVWACTSSPQHVSAINSLPPADDKVQDPPGELPPSSSIPLREEVEPIETERAAFDRWSAGTELEKKVKAKQSRKREKDQDDTLSWLAPYTVVAVLVTAVAIVIVVYASGGPH